MTEYNVIRNYFIYSSWYQKYTVPAIMLPQQYQLARTTINLQGIEQAKRDEFQAKQELAEANASVAAANASVAAANASIAAAVEKQRQEQAEIDLRKLAREREAFR